MQKDLIIISEYCIKTRIEPSFILALEEEGLIELTIIESEKYIQIVQIPDIERYIRWHYELNINIEGIDTIRHLLDKIENMQNEINVLRNQLSLHFR